MRVRWLSLAICILAAPAEAQEILTEAAFLEPFNGENAAVRALTEDLARAEGTLRRATTLGNPQIAFNQQAPEDYPRQNTWTAAWTPPLDGRRGLARDAAQMGLEAARERFAADTLQLRRELRKAFADWALSVERRDVLESQRALVEALAEQTKRRAEVGEESGIGARRLLLASSDLASELAVAEAAAIRAEALALAWRPDISKAARLIRPPLAPPPAAPGGPRPDVEALRLEAQRAKIEGRLARRLLVFPELQAGWQTQTEHGVTKSGPVWGITWSVPLFDRFQAARVEATERRRALEAQFAVAASRARAELGAAESSYAVLATRARAQERAVADTRRLVEGVSEAFRAGETSVTDLLETLRSVREARVREIDLYAEALEAQRALEAAVALPWSKEEK